MVANLVWRIHRDMGIRGDDGIWEYIYIYIYIYMCTLYVYNELNQHMECLCGWLRETIVVAQEMSLASLWRRDLGGHRFPSAVQFLQLKDFQLEEPGPPKFFQFLMFSLQPGLQLFILSTSWFMTRFTGNSLKGGQVRSCQGTCRTHDS